jgi:hypothetical protein
MLVMNTQQAPQRLLRRFGWLRGILVMSIAVTCGGSFTNTLSATDPLERLRAFANTSISLDAEVPAAFFHEISEKPLHSKNDYWSALQKISRDFPGLNVLPAGIRLDQQGLTTVTDRNQHWLAPVILGPTTNAWTTVGPLALHTDTQRYLRAAHPGQHGIYSCHLLVRHPPQPETTSRVRRLGLVVDQWSQTIAATSDEIPVHTEHNHIVLAKQAGFIDPTASLATAGIHRDATQLTLRGHLNVEWYDIHDFEVIYNNNPARDRQQIALVHLPDQTAYSVQLKRFAERGHFQQHLLLKPIGTPTSQAETWSIDPDRDIHIHNALGQRITFNNQTVVGSRSIRLRLTKPIQMGATIIGRARSPSREERLPVHLRIPLSWSTP